MNYSYYMTLIVLLIQSNVEGMKLHHPPILPTVITQTNTLSNFFLNDQELEQLCESTQTPSYVIQQIPSDIKNCIATSAFFHHKEWWYHHKTIIKQENMSYAASFMDDDTLVIVAHETPLRIFDCNSMTVKEEIFVPDNLISLAIRHDKTAILCGLDGGNIDSIDLTTKTMSRFLDTLESVWTIAYNLDSTLIAYSDAHQIKIINAETKQEVSSIPTLSIPYGLFFDIQPHILTYGLHNGAIITINLNDNTIIYQSIDRNLSLYSLNANKNRTQLIASTAKGTLLMYQRYNNYVRSKKQYSQSIYYASLNDTGNLLAACCLKGTVHLLKQHRSYSLEQLLLHKIIYLWLQTKKRPCAISSSYYLLHLIVNTFNLDYAQVKDTWQTFPSQVQHSIWLSVKKMLKKYGQSTVSLKKFLQDRDPCHTQALERLSDKRSLKKILRIWKKNQELRNTVTSTQSLLKTLTVAYNLNYQEVTDTWKAISTKTQQIMWQSIQSKINMS